MNNIYLYVGDNAQGKTRKLNEIIEDRKNKGLLVSTNLERLKDIYMPSEEKLAYFKSDIYNVDICNYLVLGTSIKSPYDKFCRDLVELLYSEGDILVLDELDVGLSIQDIIGISECISRIAHLWKEIHVSGYNIELLRMFTHIDYDTGIQEYNENVYLVRNGLPMVKLSEEETYEYFNTIRG